MTHALPLPVQAVLALLAGLVLGYVHFGALRRLSADYLSGRARRALGLQLARLGVMAAALFGLAKWGALPLLAGALGILLARAVVLRRAGAEGVGG